MRRGDAYAGVLVRLPETESGVGRILHNGHAASVKNIKGRREEFAAELLGARRGRVNVLDSDVQIPVRGHAAGSLVGAKSAARRSRSEEHTSELQSHVNLVCRLLLEKKKKK